MRESTLQVDAIAIIGIACRAPQARDLGELWERLLAGGTCISEVEPRAEEVNCRGVLLDADKFDAGLFGFSDGDAAVLDEQHRIFLELCWHALEDAGIDPFRAREAIGVYGCCTPRMVLMGGSTSLADEYHRLLAADVDFLAARVSHRLRLTGESVVVQSACSSSLLAVHLACQSLLTGHTGVALAGGISIAVDQTRGYRYQEGMILAPDGRCRPFDEHATGTVPGSGGGVVVLKRLAAALHDGDDVYAVIRGSATNNDGGIRASFLAPNVTGQANVIASALAAARVQATTIDMVEAHGTATVLGDEVELAALRRVFGAAAPATIALGSIKGSIGHLDRAAGVLGLIKATLSLRHGIVPPAVGAEQPRADLAVSPFYLPLSPVALPSLGRPSLAGVSSFGAGGANVHVVLEQAPAWHVGVDSSSRPQLVTVSARSEHSLARMRDELAEFLERGPELSPAEVAQTRSLGRPELELRTAAVGSSLAEIAAVLRDAPTRRADCRRTVFLFEGLGATDRPVSAALARYSPAYRAAVDACVSALVQELGSDVEAWIYAGTPPAGSDAAGPLEWSQSLLFVAEYALARLWLSWGVAPDSMVGHSMGEVVAATLAGTFRVEDAVAVVAERARILDDAPGAMVTVALGEEELAELLPPSLDCAAVNAPASCVVSGASSDVLAFAEDLERRGVPTRRLDVPCAAHSRLVEQLAPRLAKKLEGLELSAPTLPVVSGESGEIADPAEIVKPAYWLHHLTRTVRFGAAVATAAEGRSTVLVEFAHDRFLTRLAGLQLGYGQPHAAVVWNPAQDDPVSAVLEMLGQAWCAGTAVDWERVHDGPSMRRHLPLYPFDHRRVWPSPVARADGADGGHAAATAETIEAPEALPVAAPAVAVNETAATNGASDAERLLHLWRELLSVPVGPEDHFFESGGDSILALRMLALAREEGIEIPHHVFWDAPTVSAVVSQLRYDT